MVSVIRPFMFANWHLVKLGSTPFREKERWGGGGVGWGGRGLFSLVITFPRDDFQVLEKDIPGW